MSRISPINHYDVRLILDDMEKHEPLRTKHWLKRLAIASLCEPFHQNQARRVSFLIWFRTGITAGIRLGKKTKMIVRTEMKRAMRVEMRTTMKKMMKTRTIKSQRQHAQFEETRTTTGERRLARLGLNHK